VECGPALRGIRCDYWEGRRGEPGPPERQRGPGTAFSQTRRKWGTGRRAPLGKCRGNPLAKPLSKKRNRRRKVCRLSGPHARPACASDTANENRPAVKVAGGRSRSGKRPKLSGTSSVRQTARALPMRASFSCNRVCADQPNTHPLAKKCTQFFDCFQAPRPQPRRAEGASSGGFVACTLIKLPKLPGDGRTSVYVCLPRKTSRLVLLRC